MAHAAATGRYDDGGFSGGTMERPALKQLLDHIATGKIATVIVYKVDRLTRSLADFAKIIEVFDSHNVSFVSVTQQFNTTTSMGRLTLNVLLSFAQFERELTGERISTLFAEEARFVWPDQRALVSKRSPVPSLVKAIARDRDWYERIVSGEVSTVRQLAQKTRLSLFTPARVHAAVLASREGRFAKVLAALVQVGVFPTKRFR